MRCQRTTLSGVDLFCDQPTIGRFCVTHWLDRWRWGWSWGRLDLTITLSALPHPQVYRDDREPRQWWALHFAPDSTEPLIGIAWNDHPMEESADA